MIFKRERQEKNKLMEQLNELNNEINNLQSDSSQGQEVKNDLLLFTSKLTEKNIYLATQIKELSEELERFQINCKLQHSNDSLDSIKANLDETTEKHHLELSKNIVLEEKLITKENEIENLLLKLSDEQDEIVTLRKKHANNVKDLTRQLKQFKDKETCAKYINNNNHNNVMLDDYASKALSSSEDDLESSSN